MRKLLTLVLALFLFGFAVISATDVKASTSVPLTVTGIFDGSVPFPYTPPSVTHGSNFSFDVNSKPSGQNFAFWIVNGVVMEDLLLDHSFPVTRRMNLQVVFAPVGKYAVVFINSSGQYLGVKYASSEESFNVNDTGITVPVKFGYDVATPKWVSIKGSTSLTGVNAHSVFVVQYQASASLGTVTINVVNGSSVGSVPFNSIVNLVPNDPEPGQFFHRWEENGVVVSYDANFAFTALTDRTITAVFSATPVSSAPVVTLSRDLEVRDGYNTFSGQVEVPVGFTLYEYGFLVHANAIEIDQNTAGVVFAQSNSINDYNEFVTSFPVGVFKSVRSYMVLKNTSNSQLSYYTSSYNLRSIPDSVYSTGFEDNSPAKTAYATATTTIGGVEWNLTEALITNNDAGDKKFETKSIRGRALGNATMLSGFSNVTQIDFYFAQYGTSANGLLSVEVSKDGSNWVQIIAPMSAPAVLTKYTYSMNYNLSQLQSAGINISSNLRFKFVFTGGSNQDNTTRLNIDNFTIYSPYFGKVNDVVFFGNNNQENTTILIKDGSKVSQPSNPVSNGYVFDGWFSNESLTTPYNFNNLVYETTYIYAKWTPINYTVTYNLDGGTNDVANPASYTIESPTVTLQPATKNFYTFNGWYDNPGFTGSPVTEITSGSSGNVMLYAQFTVNQYTISFIENGGSLVTDITQNYGTAVSAPSNPTKENYTFGGWFTDDVTFLNQYTFSTMPGVNTALYAKWIDASSSATVTFNSNGGSSVDSQIVIVDQTVTEPTPPTKTGYNFVNWRTAEEVIWDFATNTVDEDITLFANWSKVTYSITYSNLEGTTHSNPLSFDVETPTITLSTPSERSGYTFSGWFTALTGGSQVTTIILGTTGNQTLYARWTSNEPVETVLYSTGFESSQGFSSSTVYNNTVIAYFGPSQQQWGFYHGATSTTGPITGLQSAQMRYYTGTPSYLGYTFTNFDISNVTRITYKLSIASGLGTYISISTDGGNTWSTPSTPTLNSGLYSFNINESGNVRVKIGLTVTGSPANAARLTLDDVTIYGYVTP